MQHITRTLFALMTLAGLSAGAQTYTQLTHMPGAIRDGALCFAIGDKVYLGGGMQSKDFYVLDNGAWTQLHDLPGVTTERWFGACFVIGDRAFIGLGSDGNSFLNDLWEYDAVNDEWNERAPYPSTPRNTVWGFAVGGKGYVCGGADNDYIYSDFYEYDPVANEWTPRGALPIGPTAFGSAFVIDNYAYIVGGDHGTSESTDLYRWDPVALEWTERAPFIGHARQTAVAFTLNGQGWFGLGQSQYTTPYADMFTYDPGHDRWTRMADFTGGVRCWAAACNTSDQAFLGTGWDFGSHFFNDWWRMDATVGITDVSAATNTLQLYPVPATDQLNVRLPNTSRTDVQVLDASGRVVRTATLVQQLSTLDVHDLAAGDYTLVALSATPMRVHFVKH